MRYYISYKELERTNPPFVPLLFSRHHHSREAKKTVMVTTTSSSSSALGAYNWTEIERYDATDLQLLLKDLEPHTKYEILLQAYNQFGRGPVAKMEAETEADGENCCCPGCKNQANQRRKVFKKDAFQIFILCSSVKSTGGNHVPRCDPSGDRTQVGPSFARKAPGQTYQL